MDEAPILAVQMGHRHFKASNGWLESFKKCHNIAVSGEAADVAEETVEGSHERVKSFVMGYKPESIWNEDETGFFYRTLPEKTLPEKKNAEVGKGQGKAYYSLPMQLVVENNRLSLGRLPNQGVSKELLRILRNLKEFLIIQILRPG